MAAPRRRGILLLVVLLVVALPIGGIVVAVAAIDSAGEIIPEVLDDFRVDGIETEEAEEDRPMSRRECEEVFGRYLKKMFSATGKAPDRLSSLFIAASEELGAGTEEYRELVEIYSTTELNGMAALGEPGKAFKRSKPLIKKQCRD